MAGTASRGKRGKGKTHVKCGRCGKRSYHARKKVCAACGFGAGTKLKNKPARKKKK